MGSVSTVAGTGVAGFNGDGSALSSQLNYPTGVAVDPTTRDFYIADNGNHLVRKVTPSGTITTVAGTGVAGFDGDGTATLKQLNSPEKVAVDPTTHDLYIADVGNQRVRKVTTSGAMSTVAGPAQVSDPRGLTVDPTTRDLYIVDRNRVRKLTTSGAMSTLAGTGTEGFSGDGGPATEAELATAYGVAVNGSKLYIADFDNQRVRVVNNLGVITTLAGSGAQGFSGDGGPATSAALNGPIDVAVDGSSNLYIAENNGCRVRKVDASDASSPNTTITSGPSGPINNPSPTFNFTASEGNSSFGCKLDSQPYEACSSPKTYAALADGPHTFYVRATDPAGNTDSTPDSRTFTVNTEEPDTTITFGPQGPTNDPSPTFRFTSTAAGSTFECRLDGGTFQPCNSPRTYSGLADGPHTFRVRATGPGWQHRLRSSRAGLHRRHGTTHHHDYLRPPGPDQRPQPHLPLHVDRGGVGL